MNENAGAKITSALKYAAKQGDEATIIKLNEYSIKNKNYYLLKKFSWLLYLNYERRNATLDLNKEKKWNVTLHRFCNYHDLLELILNIDDNIKEAYYFLLKVEAFYRESTLDTAK